MMLDLNHATPAENHNSDPSAHPHVSRKSPAKRLGALLIISSLLVSLAACGGSSSSGDSNSAPGGSGSGQNQLLTWDSGSWDSAQWQ